jgi:hypothetical protein
MSSTLLTNGMRLQRPHERIDGILYLKCRGVLCLNAGRFIPEDEFDKLYNPKSACRRLSECRECCNRRRTTNRRVRKLVIA